MHSALPKVLHSIAGKAMLQRVVETAITLSPTMIAIIYGHGGDQVRNACADFKDLAWAEQEPQLGTGHAVLQALPLIAKSDITLVVYGDVPLITAATLRRLVASANRGHLAWLTNEVPNPAGLGRVIRNAAGEVWEIVEEKDASPEQRVIREINTGFVACPTEWLARWLPTLGNRNAQGEYYLTDILKLAVTEGLPVTTETPDEAWEVAGVNSQEQVAALERTYQMELSRRLMESGVTLRDPSRLDIRGTLECESDVIIDVNVIVEGRVWLGRGVVVGASQGEWRKHRRR